MSPEQLAGVSGQKLGTAADVYSLGVMLYELGEGRDPLGLRKHEDLLTLLRTKRDKRPRPMRKITHEGLQQLLLSFLEPKALDRPDDMERIARELRRIAREEGAQREDLEYLVRVAMENRSEKRKAKGANAPIRPATPNLADLVEAEAAAPAPLRPSSPRGAPAPPRSRAPRRRPPAPPLPEPGPRLDPSAEEDFGSGSRRLSRVDQLSVKRRAARSEGIGLMSWAVVILFGAVVVFLGASASLTGSPLGLLEALVPLP
jgi:serine/threonine protein kinase